MFFTQKIKASLYPTPLVTQNQVCGVEIRYIRYSKADSVIGIYPVFNNRGFSAPKNKE